MQNCGVQVCILFVRFHLQKQRSAKPRTTELGHPQTLCSHGMYVTNLTECSAGLEIRRFHSLFAKQQNITYR